MDIIQSIFKRKTVNFEKLINYGFSKKADIYSYSTVLPASGFTMTVSITEQGEISSMVTDPALNEPYVLHLADNAAGSFVGGVKYEYEQILTDIADKCFEHDVFKTEAAKDMIKYVRSKYGSELEYLWQKFPDNAVVRRNDNQKWYAAFLTVSRRKLGFASDETAEIIDLRMTPENIEKNVDNVKILPGYHMNKKHWVTICLDGSVPLDEICRLTDESYILASKK